MVSTHLKNACQIGPFPICRGESCHHLVLCYLQWNSCLRIQPHVGNLTPLTPWRCQQKRRMFFSRKNMENKSHSRKRTAGNPKWIKMMGLGKPATPFKRDGNFLVSSRYGANLQTQTTTANRRLQRRISCRETFIENFSNQRGFVYGSLKSYDSSQ